MNHQEIINLIIKQKELDQNFVGLLVFGSMANGTQHENSDIDLIEVYKSFDKGYDFSTKVLEGIKIGQSKWSYDHLVSNIKNVPYLMFIFANAKILLDNEGEVKFLQTNIQNYFILHPGVSKDWIRYAAEYEQEKKIYGVGKTPIKNVLDQLEMKYSGGVIKRTFLN